MPPHTRESCQLPALSASAARGAQATARKHAPNILMRPSVASRNWSVSTPASDTGTSTNDCACASGNGGEVSELGVRG